LRREDLDPKIHVVLALAVGFGLPYIDLDGLFAESYVKMPCEYFAADGMHPTAARAGLIAMKWLKSTGMYFNSKTAN